MDNNYILNIYFLSFNSEMITDENIFYEQYYLHKK